MWTGGSQRGNSLETTRRGLAISIPPSRWQEMNAWLHLELLRDGTGEIQSCSLEPWQGGSVPAQSGSPRFPNTLTNEASQEIREPDVFCPTNEVTWEDAGS